MSATVTCSRWEFFGDVGSIEGAETTTRSPGTSGCTNSFIVKTIASYGSRKRRTKPQISGCGSAQSMWQRHIQCFAMSNRLSPRSMGMAIGCGSCTTATSYPPGSDSRFDRTVSM
jgi:hypothetical protein